MSEQADVVAEQISYSDALYVLLREGIDETMAERVLIDAVHRGVIKSTPARYPTPYGPASTLLTIMLNRADFFAWQQNLTMSGQNSGKVNGKNKGGRPPGYDYEGALIELARFLYNEKASVEITEGFLFQHARDWLRAKPDDGPVDFRQLKDRVHRFYETVIKDGET